jgi:hypothetical protein
MDLPSLLQAVNSLKRVLQDTIGPGLAGGFTSPNMGPPIVADRPNWFETDRDTRNLRVYHKDADGKQDKSMYIDVVRIDKIVFQYLYDDPYGETFDWQYKR